MRGRSTKSLGARSARVESLRWLQATAVSGELDLASQARSTEVPVVRRGSLIEYRIFDACDGIDLLALEMQLVAARVERSSLQFQEAPRREVGALRLSAAPLHVALGERTADLSQGPVEVDASVRVFDHGTFAVAFEMAVTEPTGLDELRRRISTLSESRRLTELARAEYQSLCDKAGDCFRGRHEVGEIGRYTVLFIEELAPKTNLEALLEWPALPKLLAGELDSRSVSNQQREDVLRFTDAYLEDDAVIIGSTCTVLVEPTRTRDVLQIIELVRAQMAQLACYDDQLDRELAGSYRDFDRGQIALAFYSPFGTTLRKLSKRLVELTEFTERIDNSLKIVTDAYLARVYRKAVDRFAVAGLKARVAHKQRLLLDLYTVLKDEVQILRSFVLEILIVVLILTEVGLALFGH